MSDVRGVVCGGERDQTPAPATKEVAEPAGHVGRRSRTIAESSGPADPAIAGGLIQVQSFVPDAAARTLLPEILRLCRERGIVSSLGVLKRHRPDPFLLTHGLDGWSLALDFRVTPSRRDPLWQLGRDIADRVLAAGGSFYLAKDAILRPADLETAYKGRLEEFRGIKRRLDPGNLLMSDQGRRLLPG